MASWELTFFPSCRGPPCNTKRHPLSTRTRHPAPIVAHKRSTWSTRCGKFYFLHASRSRFYWTMNRTYHILYQITWNNEEYCWNTKRICYFFGEKQYFQVAINKSTSELWLVVKNSCILQELRKDLRSLFMLTLFYVCISLTKMNKSSNILAWISDLRLENFYKFFLELWIVLVHSI